MSDFQFESIRVEKCQKLYEETMISTEINDGKVVGFSTETLEEYIKQ